MRRLACFAPVVLSAVLASASSSAGPTMSGRGAPMPRPIINGKVDTSANDAVVLLLLIIDATKGEIGECSGTVIAPHVIVTARHCVSILTDGDGGDGVGADYSTSQITVYTGVTPALANSAGTGLAAPQATVKQIIHDTSTTLDNHDFSIIVTNEAIAETPRTVRTKNNSATRVGETTYVVGYGLTEADTTVAAEESNEIPTRHIRTAENVNELGPATFEGLAIGSSEIRLGESVCEGDSGGGLFDSTTNALVASTSRGGNGDEPDAADPVLTCVGSTEVDLFTVTSDFLAQIQTALAVNCETATDEDGSTIYGTGCPSTVSDAGAATDTGTSTGGDAGTTASDAATSGGSDAATGSGDAATGTGTTKESGGCSISGANGNPRSRGVPPLGTMLGALLGLSVLRRRRG